MEDVFRAVSKTTFRPTSIQGQMYDFYLVELPQERKRPGRNVLELRRVLRGSHPTLQTGGAARKLKIG